MDIFSNLYFTYLVVSCTCLVTSERFESPDKGFFLVEKMKCKNHSIQKNQGGGVFWNLDLLKNNHSRNFWGRGGGVGEGGEGVTSIWRIPDLTGFSLMSASHSDPLTWFKNTENYLLGVLAVSRNLKSQNFKWTLNCTSHPYKTWQGQLFIV